MFYIRWLNSKLINWFWFGAIVQKKCEQVYSNICTRWLQTSQTIIWPLLRTAKEAGLLNSPKLPPSIPNLPRNFPFSSNTCILWLFSSQTIKWPDLFTNKPLGLFNSPSPPPFFPNLYWKFPFLSRNFDTMFTVVWHYEISFILNTMDRKSKKSLLSYLR